MTKGGTMAGSVLRWRRGGAVRPSGAAVVVETPGEDYDLTDEQLTAAVKALSLVRKDPREKGDSAAAFVREWGLLRARAARGASEKWSEISDDAFRLRETADMAGALQRRDYDDMRQHRELRERPDLSEQQLEAFYQSEVAKHVNRYTEPPHFRPEGARGFARRRTPESLVEAVFAQLEAWIIRDQRLHVCKWQACHAIFTRPDEREQLYHDKPCEVADYYEQHKHEINAKRRAVYAETRRGHTSQKGKRT